MNGTANIPVTLVLNLRAKNLLLEEFPLAARDLHPRSSEQKDPTTDPQLSDERRWLLKKTVHNLAGVGRFVMGLLNDITLHNSPELKNYITGQLQQYHKKESETGTVLDTLGYDIVIVKKGEQAATLYFYKSLNAS